MSDPAVYYDPYDIEIDADPYPTYRRLRDEAPLYHNEKYDFWGLSRFADVESALKDWQRLSSAKGDILEVVKADPVMPPGVFINEDPPFHTVHRALVSRVFTPKRINTLEDKVRAFCAACLDPFVGADRFDFVVDLGAELPMRAIGMLLGIPDADQPKVREHAKRNLRNRPGEPLPVKKDRYFDSSMYAEYLTWREQNPSDDLDHRAPERRVRGCLGRDASPDQGGDPHVPRGDRGCGRRHHRPPVRVDGQGARRAPRPARARSWRTGPSSATRSRSSCASNPRGHTWRAMSPKPSSITGRPSRPGVRCC